MGAPVQMKFKNSSLKLKNNELLLSVCRNDSQVVTEKISRNRPMKQKFPMAAMFINGSGQNQQIP
jgi:hypothetical protein